jgi:hypothetical protein
MHPIFLFHTNVSPTVINIKYLLPTSLWGEKVSDQDQKATQNLIEIKKLTLLTSNLTYEMY